CDADQHWIWFHMLNEHQQYVQFVMIYRSEAVHDPSQPLFELHNEMYSVRIVFPQDPMSVLRQSASQPNDGGMTLVQFQKGEHDYHYYPHDAFVTKVTQDSETKEFFINQQKMTVANRFIQMFKSFQSTMDSESKQTTTAPHRPQSARDRLRRKLEQKKKNTIAQSTDT